MQLEYGVSVLWCRPVAQLLFDPYPGNHHLPQMRPLKDKKKEEYLKEKEELAGIRERGTAENEELFG